MSLLGYCLWGRTESDTTDVKSVRWDNMGLDSLARRGEEDARAPGCGRLARWTRAPGKRNWKAAYNPFWKLSEAGTPSFRSLCLGVSAETYLGQLSACRVALGQIPMRGRATGVNLRSVVPRDPCLPWRGKLGP